MLFLMLVMFMVCFVQGSAIISIYTFKFIYPGIIRSNPIHVSEPTLNATVTSSIQFGNQSIYEVLTNMTYKEAEASSWNDMSSGVSCLGGWFRLPSGKVVCHVTTPQLYEQRRQTCSDLGIML